MLNSSRFTSIIIAISLMIVAPAAVFAADIKVGVLGSVQGQVTAVAADGKQRALKAGDEIFQNEVIRTEKEARAQILFLDKSALTLTPGSEVKIDSFIYDPASSKGGMTLKGAKGAFRFIGGALSKNDHVEIKTPVSTIGIRGGIAETHIAPGGKSAEAIFIYGHDMTITSEGKTLTLTDFGSGASVQQGTPPVMMTPQAVEQKMNHFNAISTDAPPAKTSGLPKTADDSNTNTASTDTTAPTTSDGSTVAATDGSTTKSEEGTTATSTTTTTTTRDSTLPPPPTTTSTDGTASTTTTSRDGSTTTMLITQSTTTTLLPTTTTTTLTRDAITSSTINTTQTTSQETFVARAPTFTHSGTYLMNSTSLGGWTTGKAGFFVEGTDFKGEFREIGPVSGRITLGKLPIYASSGPITSTSGATVGSMNLSGFLTVSQQQSMYFYDLSGGGILRAIIGQQIAGANWAGAAAASITASMAAGTNSVTFYRFLPELMPNSQGQLHMGSMNTGYGLAVDWQHGLYVGGNIDWNTTSTSNPEMVVLFGTVDTSGTGPLLGGTAIDFSGQDGSTSTNDKATTQLGFTRTTEVYGVNGSGAIEGMVIEGVLPTNVANLPSDVFTAAGERHLVPLMSHTVSGQTATATGNRNSGTLGGFAAGFLVNTTTGSAPRAYWNDTASTISITKNAGLGTVTGSFSVTNVGNPADTIITSFGGGTAESAFVSDTMYASQQNSVLYAGNPTINDIRAASGVIVAADLISNVQNHCTQCEYVHWGVWGAQINTGTTTTPNYDVVHMMPYVAGELTNDLVNNAAASALGPVTYSGAVYGTVHNHTTNMLSQQEGAFSSVINLSTRNLTSFNANLGSMQFGTTTPTALTSPPGGSTTFTGVAVHDTGGVHSPGNISGSINGALFGPNAENLGGNFKINSTSANSSATGVYLGARP